MQVSLSQAIDLLKQGEVVAIPTETVYGLAADARNENALREIYRIKQRPASNPLIVHIASSEQVLDWAADFPSLAQRLAQTFWPGPLTLVLPARSDVSIIVRAGEPTVALRVPNHPLAQQVLQQSGLGLAAPSANRYTQLSPTIAKHVEDSLGQQLPVLDGGACKVGIESTIIAVESDQWQLLRLGMITEAEIASVAGKPALKGGRHTPKAPGQHLLHYSPTTPMKLFSNREELLAFAETEPNCAAILLGDGVVYNCKTFNLPNEAVRMAEKLYDTLHQMDALGVSLLLIEAPPNTAEWLAIHDRLSRASHQFN
jgi:L-threonylcarbamoyladenylate synthase